MLSASNEEETGLLRRFILEHAIKNSATKVLSSLIEKYGADVRHLPSWTAAGEGNTSVEILEVLLAHGWEINHHSRTSTMYDAYPFLWHAVADVDMVAWCLKHGAKVHPKDLAPIRFDIVDSTNTTFDNLLENCAVRGSVPSFDLLLSNKAPLGWRPLHLAIEAATVFGGDPSQQEEGHHVEEAPTTARRRAAYSERLAMVRHLVDVVGLDVNALDSPAGTRMLPTRLGTPLCYVSGAPAMDKNTRELTWFLLDSGADPDPALKLAELCGHPTFLQDFLEWKESRGVDSYVDLNKQEALNSRIRHRSRCIVQ